MTQITQTGVGSDTRTFPISLGDAQVALKELAARQPGDAVKRAIENAAKRAGLSYWRAFDLWYGKARRIEDFERVQIATAIARKREQDARAELHDLRLRLTRLESILTLNDTKETALASGSA
jgi:hypothetical protein